MTIMEKTGNRSVGFAGMIIAVALVLTACGGGGNAEVEPLVPPASEPVPPHDGRAGDGENDEVEPIVMPETEPAEPEDGDVRASGSAAWLCHFCADEVIENSWGGDGQGIAIGIRVEIPFAGNFEMLEGWGSYGIHPAGDGTTWATVNGQSPPPGVPRDHPVFSETLAWYGRLVGFTPQGESVTGSARLVIEPEEHYVHSLEFRNLESWAADAMPNQARTSAQWGDGDLHYYVRMLGVGFMDYRAREGFNKVLSDDEIGELVARRLEATMIAESLDDGTPEGMAEAEAFLTRFYNSRLVVDKSFFPTLEREMDDGAVSGSLFGDSFVGMGGVLYRDDLTAAFGGSR